MGLIEVTGPSFEPLHLDDAKLHLRVDHSDEDRPISSLILAARQSIEEYTARALVVRPFQQTLDAFPADSESILLKRSPLAQLSSITYLDADGALQTLNSSSYDVDGTQMPARIRLAPDESWPETEANRINAVTLSYYAGHATPFTVNPSTDEITSLGQTFEDDDRVQFTNTGGAVPAGLTAGTFYFVRDASGAVFKVAATSGGSAIDITDTGSGTTFIGGVPGALMAALRLLIGAWYESPTGLEPGGAVELPGPGAVRAILQQHRIFRFT